jgi:5,10-methylenetetrahydromethanopterin reductase
MISPQVSIAIQTDKTPAEYIALAKFVDLFDFDAVSVYCDAPYHPSYGPLLLMAPHIHRACLGPAAVSPFRMHPIDIAANAALLSRLTYRGSYIGLARGAWLGDYGIWEPSKPILGIQESVSIIRKLLKGESAGMRGEVFRIADHVHAPYPLPEVDIPIMIGTWGPKLAKLGGMIADEIKVGGSTNPAIALKILPNIYHGETKAGRLDGEVGLVFGAVTVVDEDRRSARIEAKRALCLYLPVVAKLDHTIMLDPDYLGRIKTLVEQGDFDSAGKLISDELLEKLAFAGNVDDVVRQAESLLDAGVNRIEFGAPHGLKPQDGIRLIGEKILPKLKSWK